MSLSIVFLLSSITSTRLESSKLIKRFAPRIMTSAERKILIIMNQNESGKDVTRLEIFSLEDILSIDTSNKLANIPGEIFLEYTFTIYTKFSAKCIESGFCGDRLYNHHHRWSYHYQSQ